MDLIIVESPTKAKTITRFLGKGYKVLSSFGHVRDLPKSKIGIDTDGDFEPIYEVPARAKKHVTELKAAAKKADIVYYATDEDRAHLMRHRKSARRIGSRPPNRWIAVVWKCRGLTIPATTPSTHVCLYTCAPTGWQFLCNRRAL